MCVECVGAFEQEFFGGLGGWCVDLSGTVLGGIRQMLTDEGE